MAADGALKASGHIEGSIAIDAWPPGVEQGGCYHIAHQIPIEPVATKRPRCRREGATVAIRTDAEHLGYMMKWCLASTWSTGLLWQDLQAWFEQTQGLVAGAGKQLLYRRLLACLPDSSPVQRLAFTNFYKDFPKTDIPRLPALLSEVWFHWGPQTVVQRGKAALLHSRLDFLLLLPGGRRVVIEVDGQHHYTTDDGRASPKRYSDI